MTKKILIASGGTGGHIFPAIVFGKKLESEGNIVSWLCGSRELEKTIYHESNIDPVILPMSGSPLGVKSITKIFSRFIDLIKSIIITAKYIKTFNPDEIYLFGGYISFAPLTASRFMRKKIPVTLHEQNAVAGKVTRIAEKSGVKILTGWPICEGIKNFDYVGIPVREPVRISREKALMNLGLNLDVNAKIVGIAGGSLGSGPLSELLKSAAKLCGDIEFVFLSSKKKYDDENMHFILPQWDMNPFYSMCDVVVCRAGGSTLAEIMKWNIPAVTIAWKNAADNHQEKNAQEFVKLYKNGRMFSESGKPEELAGIIKEIMKQ